jgi:peptidoglycan-associated lipoprotein
MRMPSLKTLMMLLALGTATAPGLAQAPVARAELALDYTWMHSNAPPGGCGCFSLQGGSATAALPLAGLPISLVADVTVGNTSPSAPGFNGSLRLTTITGGLRYTPWLRTLHRWQPFVQAMAGVTHAGGSLASAPYPAVANARATFAGAVGGGLDVRLGRHVALRLIDAEYLATTFANGSNNRQSNARLSTGVVLRF